MNRIKYIYWAQQRGGAANRKWSLEAQPLAHYSHSHAPYSPSFLLPRSSPKRPLSAASWRFCWLTACVAVTPGVFDDALRDASRAEMLSMHSAASSFTVSGAWASAPPSRASCNHRSTTPRATSAPYIWLIYSPFRENPC